MHSSDVAPIFTVATCAVLAGDSGYAVSTRQRLSCARSTRGTSSCHAYQLVVLSLRLLRGNNRSISLRIASHSGESPSGSIAEHPVNRTNTIETAAQIHAWLWRRCVTVARSNVRGQARWARARSAPGEKRDLHPIWWTLSLGTSLVRKFRQWSWRALGSASSEKDRLAYTKIASLRHAAE